MKVNFFKLSRNKRFNYNPRYYKDNSNEAIYQFDSVYTKHRNLNYLDPELELKVVLSKVQGLDNKEGVEIAKNMISVANLSRQGFANGDISTLMSPRTVISWAENYQIFNDLNKSFEITFLNKCDETERVIIAEYYQRCFDSEAVDSIAEDIEEA